MKTVPAALQSALDAGSATIVRLWRITRRDGVILGFTDADADVVHDGTTFRRASGAAPSAGRSERSGGPDDLEIVARFDDDAITEEDLIAGLYTDALVDVFVGDPTLSPPAFVRMPAGGRIGQVANRDGTFSASLRGLQALLSQPVVRTITPGCRWDLGQPGCNRAMGDLTDAGQTVIAVSGARSFTASLPRAAGAYDIGLLTWTNGANAGKIAQVESWDGATVFLRRAPVRAMAPGDAFTITEGCNRTPDRCKALGNFVNFGGFNFVPSSNDVIVTPDAPQ